MNTSELFEGFNDSGTYSGPGEVTFDKPSGRLYGQATVIVARRPEIRMEISGFEIDPAFGDSPLALEAFLLGELPEQQGGRVVVTLRTSSEARRPSGISVQTEVGIFSATSALLNSPTLLAFSQNNTISLIPNDLTFTSATKEDAKFWLNPLQGPFAKHYLRRQGPSHPMGLGNAAHYEFGADGLSCGFQICEPGNNPQHPLADVDAIVFGQIRGPVNTVENIGEELPAGLEAALGFAVGADVSTPWIETRSAAGHLVCRFFVRPGKHVAEEGFPAFTQVNEFKAESGIGAFLKAFYALPRARRKSLITPLNLMRSGSPGAFTIEDSITDLVKALDNLCASHGFITQNLLGRLTDSNRIAVKAVMDAARATLLGLRAQNATALDQAEVINLILDRISNATNTARDFGLAVRDLLNKFALSDGEVMDGYFGALNNGTTWADLLSKVRGEVIHKGHLYISDRQHLRNWFAFSRHLHDLCKRIVLSEANYQGTYQASTNPWPGEYRVDRVKPGMRVADLGFEEVPTTI